MSDAGLLRDFLRAADIGRSRSSIVNQLQWTSTILIAAILAILIAHGPNWLLIFFAVLVTLNLVVFWCAFVYFMRKRPHALRSEQFDLAMTKELDRRERELDEGHYVEVSDLSELRKPRTRAGTPKKEKGN